MSPPRFVTMLTTPPENRPYSAEMPDVEHLRFLDRVLDEQVVVVAEQVVVDVDTVHQEHVVARERAADGDLPGVGTVVGEAGRELGDEERRAAGGQRC